MSLVCGQDKCAGCMACLEICPKNAITIEDRMLSYNAIIDESKCIGCDACHRVCQENSIHELRTPIAWHQGWARNAEIRLKSSSGGFATAISKCFIENKGIVYSCGFENGEFKFIRIDSISELSQLYGSKYVKSNPYGVYSSITSDLKKGAKVLFIGLPCQVSAVRNYVGKDIDKELYTADLICHGTPSPKVLDIFLEQYGIDRKEIDNINFREKANAKQKGKKYIKSKGVRDKYTIAFLEGLTYTENCYECKYARLERVSDITLGDSWGTNLGKRVCKDGVSLALCQTLKGEEIIKKADVELLEVDLNNAILHNRQLEYPSKKPNSRETLFIALADGKKFDCEILKRLPKQCLKQNMKSIMAHMGLNLKRKNSTLDYGIVFERKCE